MGYIYIIFFSLSICHTCHDTRFSTALPLDRPESPYRGNSGKLASEHLEEVYHD